MVGKLFGRNGHHKESYMNIYLVIGNPKNILSIRKKKCLSLVVLLVISFIVWENQRAVQEHIGESLPIVQSIFVPFLISK